jgi:hypothetical protein
MVRNSWQHGMYSFYPPPPVVQEGEEYAAADKEVNSVVGNQNNSHVRSRLTLRMRVVRMSAIAVMMRR